MMVNMSSLLSEIVVVSGRESSETAAGEPTSRAARKRRMDLRNLRTIDTLSSIPLPAAACIPESKRPSPRVREQQQQQQEDEEEEGEEAVVDEGRLVECCPAYGMISVCGKRAEMEDAVSIRPHFLTQGLHFFAVFDGHGCSHVAFSCKDWMHELVAEELESAAGNHDSSRHHEWKEVMEKSFSSMEAKLLSGAQIDDDAGRKPPRPSCKCDLQSSSNCDYVGSTAVVAVLSSHQIVVANCGDSRAILSRGGVPVPLSSDHKPDRPDELRRIREAGGRVIYWDEPRVLGVLAMSRAIGDNLLKPYVTCEPEVTVTERTDEDEFLILASDGLLDVVSNKVACDVVRLCLRDSKNGTGGNNHEKQTTSDKACRAAAFLLTKLAMARNSSDNISVVVVDLTNRTRRRRNSCCCCNNNNKRKNKSRSG